jgi:hypothetical protein
MRFWNLTQDTISEFYLAPVGKAMSALINAKTTRTAPSITTSGLRITGVEAGV